MQIIVADQPIEFTLEHEKNLLELHENLEQWLNQENLVVTGIEINGELINIDEREHLAGYSIDQVETFKVDCKSKEEVAFESMQSLNEYLGRMQAIVENDVDYILQNRSEALSGLVYISDALDSLRSSLPIRFEMVIQDQTNLDTMHLFLKTALIELNKHLQNKAYVEELFVQKIGPKIETIQKMITTLPLYYFFFSALQNNQWEDTHFTELIPRVCSNLKEFEASFPDIRSNLQTGKDFEGITLIRILINQLELLVYLFEALKRYKGESFQSMEYKGEQIQPFIEGLNELLEEIVDAFESEDMVLLSDLFEYELAERFENMEGLLTFIHESLF
jgi:hypothetical protein